MKERKQFRQLDVAKPRLVKGRNEGEERERETHDNRCPGSQLSLLSFFARELSEKSAAGGPERSLYVWFGKVVKSQVS
jgi:hypothetical protein